MKKTAKVLAVLLALCFCFSALILTVSAAASDVPKGDKFSFGMFPQTRVSDRSLINQLNTTRALTKKDAIVLDGIKYQAYRIEDNSNPGGGPFGIMYGYVPGTTYWFRYEPIVWRVLDSSADGVLLMSEYVLCTHTFNDEIRADNTWESSDVRAWLNGDFKQMAFTANEQAFLLDSALTNEDNPVHGRYNGVPSSYLGDVYKGYPYCGTESGNDTVDKIFLPSFNEITNKAYGFNVDCNAYGDHGEFVGYYEEGGKSGRQASGTEYAKCQGVWANLTSQDGMPVPTCRYWLRTAGFDETCAAAVLEDGRVSTGWSVNYDIVGIRPLVRVAADAVADNTPFNPDEEQQEPLPFHIDAPAGEFHYKQRNVQLKADTDVTWTSSDPRIASIDENGNVTINRVGTVTITATSKETGETVEFQMEISYLWWQQLIRIFLFGWIWY